MRKIRLSLVLVGILGASNAMADTDGVFLGVQAGYGAADTRFENQTYSQSLHFTDFRYGLLAGYKQLFGHNYGTRYYVLADLGTDYKKGDAKMSSYNVSANIDGLYNFNPKDGLGFGAFIGWSLGYANHTFKALNIDDIKVSGFDFAFNFGLGVNIAFNHAIELYSRFSLLNQKKDFAEANQKYSSKVHQPYQVGLRYTFSF